MKKRILTIIAGVVLVIAVFIAAVPSMIAFAAGGIAVSSNTLNVGMGGTGTFTITATNAAGRVDITSNNTDIATVSVDKVFLDSGLQDEGSAEVTVTGTGVGSTTITVNVTDATTFDEESLNSSSYTITVNVAPVVVQDEVLTLEEGDIMLLRAGDLSDIEERISTGATEATFTHLDKNRNARDTDTLQTGDIVIVTVNSVDYEYEISILGDVNGDSLINSADYIKIKKHIMETEVIQADSAIFFAADITKDSNVNSGDYIKVRKYIMNGGGNIWEI